MTAYRPFCVTLPSPTALISLSVVGRTEEDHGGLAAEELVELALGQFDQLRRPKENEAYASLAADFAVRLDTPTVVLLQRRR